MKREGLGPQSRLHRREEFQECYSRGEKIVGQWFLAYALPREKGGLRVGVVAGRGVGDAVRRNRAKRRLRELFRRNRPEGVAADVVLVARRGILKAPFGELRRAYREVVAGRLARAARFRG